MPEYKVKVRNLNLNVVVGYIQPGTEPTRDDPGEDPECEILEINGLTSEVFDADFLDEVAIAILDDIELTNANNKADYAIDNLDWED